MTRSDAAGASRGAETANATQRLVALAATWAMLVAAAPGVLADEGLLPVAALALVPWALVCSRPGPAAFWIEWLVSGLGSAALCIWTVYVWSGILGFVALVPGLYHAGSGVALRVLARRLPLAVAAPAAWVLLEVPRCLIEPPFSYGWMRLGTFAHATPWLAGSARVWGVFGLSVVLAAFAGGLADLARGRFRRLGPAVGLALPALAAVLTVVVRAPDTRDGPRVLLVQPAVPQERKQEAPDSGVLFAEQRALTVRGLDELRARGEPAPDLVAWGETMLPLYAMADGLEQALARGVRSPDWARDQVERAGVASWRYREEAWVGGALFGARDHVRVVPEGASFLAGCEMFLVHDGEIRRANAVLLWGADGRRAGVGGKLHMVPGGEDLAGAERIAWIRATAQSIAGYVPDLVAFPRTAVLTLDARDGRARWRFGVTVCFDNAYDDPYTEPLRRADERPDFHLVCSNEAWFRESFELDQMLAFSRLIAIQTGRAVVRATNSGVSVVLAPDGSETARLVRDGRDRMVSGTLAATVPVPVDGALVPPYVRWERAWLALWGGGPGALVLAALLRRRRP